VSIVHDPLGATQPALLDPSRLADVFGDDDAGRLSLLARFVTLSTATIGELSEAIEAGDAATVERLAHGLKGRTAMVGADHMSRIAAHLSAEAGGGRLAGAAWLHSEIQLAFELTRDALMATTAKVSPRDGALAP